MRLGLTLPMLPQETLPSLVSHIAQKNGSRYVQDFVQDMGLSWRRILQLEPEALQDLADLTGADSRQLAAHSLMPTGDGGFHLGGHNLPRSFLDRSTLKLCPLCAQADIVDHGRTGGRAEWQIDPLNVCPLHGVLFHALPLPDYPRCPHDFAGRMAEGSIDGGPVAEAGTQPWRFARYLSDRLLRPCHDESSAWLDALPIDVAARLCENVGILMLHGPDTQLKALDREARVQACATGFTICAEGPDALKEAYDSIRRQSSSQRGGFYADFGFFTRWLQRLSQPDRHRPVLDHFRTFVSESYPLAPGQEVLGQSCTQRRWGTWAELERKYGLSPGRIARFQGAKGLSGDDLRRVAPGHHEDELAALASGLDRKQAARHLNLHPSAIDRFVEAGLLRHAIALPQMDRLFLQRDLDAFMASIFDKAVGVDDEQDGACSLLSIARKAKLQHVDVLRAVQNRRLKSIWRLRSIDGLPALRLDLAEVIAGFEGPPLTGLTRTDLTKRLHINCSTVSLLLSRRMIESTRAPNPRTRKRMSLIAPEAVDRFLDTYLPLGLMAHDLGTQAKHVSARLDKAGVWPIPLPDRCSVIYLRAEAAPIIAI